MHPLFSIHNEMKGMEFRAVLYTDLLLRQDPIASRAALEQKFSDAISSRPEHCLLFSARMMLKISGSSCSKLSFPVQINRLAAWVAWRGTRRTLLPAEENNILLELKSMLSDFSLLLKVCVYGQTNRQVGAGRPNAILLQGSRW